MSTVLYKWEDATKELTLLCRESGAAIWNQKFPCFADAKKCADAFCEQYAQGVRHGKLAALEEMRRTIDHMQR